MTVVSSENAVPVVLEFCNLQRRLVERFMEVLRPKDLEYFSDIERRGSIQLGAQSWRYIRHGAGVLFEAPEAIIDAHTGLALVPDGVDEWRLLHYLESRGISALAFEGKVVAGDDEDELMRLLERMTLACILEEVRLEPLRRLFHPIKSSHDSN